MLNSDITRGVVHNYAFSCIHRHIGCRQRKCAWNLDGAHAVVVNAEPLLPYTVDFFCIEHFDFFQPVHSAWVTDVTEFKVNDQKLYLSPIIDLFNGEVVSYNLSRHPNFKQVTDMLEGAFQKLPDKVDDLILHSDQGWQYQMKLYQNLLKAKGITQSMSRKATCLDNAVAENFFGLLKTELFYLEKFSSINQLEKAIVEYIDYYNNRRIKLKLNGLSPVQYRIQTVRVA